MKDFLSVIVAVALVAGVLLGAHAVWRTLVEAEVTIECSDRLHKIRQLQERLGTVSASILDHGNGPAVTNGIGTPIFISRQSPDGCWMDWRDGREPEWLDPQKACIALRRLYSWPAK